MNKNLKFIAAAAAAVLFSFSVHAQTEWDAYKLSQQFYTGTARSASMGNAFTSLGGDLGAVSINPASSGVYRYSEFTFTPSLLVSKNTSDYLDNTYDDSKTRFSISNAGFMINNNTGHEDYGIISVNFGIVYNMLNNFSDKISATGSTAKTSYLGSLAHATNGINGESMDINNFNDPYSNIESGHWSSVLGWNTSLLDTLPGTSDRYKAATENLNGNIISVGGQLYQNFTREVTGNVSETAFNVGMNIANTLFVGMNLGLQSIYYKYKEYYSEQAANSADFYSGFESFSHSYHLKTTGTGINVKVGAIFVPFKWLRLGASITTPTWMYLTDEWHETMSSSFSDGYAQYLKSPLGSFEYRLTTPFRWNAGLSLVYPGIGVFSVDYESVNYSQMRLRNRGGDDDYYGSFTSTNHYINEDFRNSDIWRTGIEINVTDQLDLRGGYQFMSSGEKGYNEKFHTGSLGLGYHDASGFFVDLAYRQYMKKVSENFKLYGNVTDNDGNVEIESPTGRNKNTKWQVLATFGFRF